MTKLRYHFTMLTSAVIMAFILVQPVAGSETGEDLQSINWMDLIATLIEWIAILFEEAAKGLRDGLDFLMEIMETSEESS